MPPFAKPIALALALSVLATTPGYAEDWSSLLLDRTVTLTLPDGFAPEPAFSDASSGAAIVEFLPPGETIEDWSQMLTLTGYDDNGSLTADQAVIGMANHLAEGYGNACPTSFSAEDLGAPAIPGTDAVFAAWLACGDAGGSGRSEAMVVLVFTAGGTVYTAQWAERGSATSSPPVFDRDRWLPRLDALMTLQL